MLHSYGDHDGYPYSDVISICDKCMVKLSVVEKYKKKDNFATCFRHVDNSMWDKLCYSLIE